MNNTEVTGLQNHLKVGLALGSGASRGMAHIGVLEVLENYGIKIDYIAGSSIGAVIGALYCAGEDLKYIAKLASKIPTKAFIDFSFTKNGLIAGHRIKTFLNNLLKNQTFKHLKIPLSIVATDLISCERFVFTEGYLSEAIRASISIPGVFEPYRYGNRLLVDGGVIDRVPVNVVRQMGADIVIASDVGFNGGSFKINSFFDVIIRSLGIMEKEIVNTRVMPSDVVIKPQVDDINPASFEQSELCVQRGKEAAEKVIYKILSLTRLSKALSI